MIFLHIQADLRAIAICEAVKTRMGRPSRHGAETHELVKPLTDGSKPGNAEILAPVAGLAGRQHSPGYGGLQLKVALRAARSIVGARTA
jgi:hypothetical protein